MLLNRKTEYAMIALRFLVSQQRTDAAVSVLSIGERFNLPVILLSKIMQELKQNGYVASKKGRSGGYRLQRDLSKVSFISFLADMGEAVEMMTCVETDGALCAQYDVCELKSPLRNVQLLVIDALKNVSLLDALGVDGTTIAAA